MDKSGNNNVMMSGKIVKNFEFSHEVYKEKFYTSMIEVERLSEEKDILPIMVSDRLVDVKEDWIGQFVEISGQFRSHNQHKANRKKLELFIFVRQFEKAEIVPFVEGKNIVTFNGYICRKPTYRKTPLGREITDILLAVNRPYGKSDYIPCIAWGRNAMFTESLEVGTKLWIEGRIQSRKYQKKISENETEIRVAYEVSISKMEVTEDEQS